jgi:hypothetical protein
MSHKISFCIPLCHSRMNVVNVEVTRSKDLQKLAKNKIWKFEKKKFFSTG